MRDIRFPLLALLLVSGLIYLYAGSVPDRHHLIEELSANEDHDDHERYPVPPHEGIVFQHKQEDLHMKLEEKEYEKFSNLRQWLGSYESSSKLDDNSARKKVVLVSGCDYYDPEILEKSLQNREEYCSRHEGVVHHFVNFTSYPTVESPQWKKLHAIEEAFAEYPDAEWVWWLDIDAIIMNSQVNVTRDILHPTVLKDQITYDHPIRNIDSKFEGHKYPSKHSIRIKEIGFVISQDSLGLNAGSFFIRRSKPGARLLQLWKDMKHGTSFKRAEQDALIEIMLQHGSLLKRTALVPQRTFNSYHDDSYSHIWRYREGDFVVHFAGKSGDKRYKEIYNRYFSERN
uniref:ARAD1D13684p n=1 Tax=Blastobotrys adeninivorans TaxID=409370 RepID=A0A060T9Q6_BLAAD